MAVEDSALIVCRINVREPLAYVGESVFVGAEGWCVKNFVLFEDDPIIDSVKPSRSCDEVFPRRPPTTKLVNKGWSLYLLVL